MNRAFLRLAVLTTLLLIVSLAPGCFEESGKEYAGVPEGKVAPPGATLVKEWAEEESFAPAAYKREYRSALSQGDVSRFYYQALVPNGWSGSGYPQDHEDRVTWSKGSLTITVAHDMKKSQESHWVVTVRPLK